MHGAGDKIRQSRRRRFRSFTPRGSLNDLLPRTNQTTKALPTEREDEITRELAKFRKYPLGYDIKKDPEGKGLVVFRDGITPRDEGEKWAVSYVTNTIDLMICEHHDYDASTAEFDKLYSYLQKDPVGIETIPFSDRVVWKKNDNVNSDESGGEGDDGQPEIVPADKFTATPFGDTLFVYHKMMYKFMRACLPIYLDKVANERLSLWIISKEFNLDDGDKLKRLDKGIRIPWAEMKEFVLSTICLATLGSYKYLPLHQLKR